jgi:hypothetical protein
MKKRFAVLFSVLTALISSGVSAQNYYQPAYAHGHNHRYPVSDGVVAGIFGALIVGAVIENRQQQRRHEEQLLRTAPRVIVVDGLTYTEQYQTYRPCPVNNQSYCVLLTRIPTNTIIVTENR